MRFAGSSPQIAKYMTTSPSYGDVGNMFQQARGKNKAEAHQAEGFTSAQGLDALGKIKTAEAQAPGIVAQGAAQGAASEAQGMAGMMSGIASGIGGMSFGGGGGGGFGYSPSIPTSYSSPVSTAGINMQSIWG